MSLRNAFGRFVFESKKKSNRSRRHCDVFKFSHNNCPYLKFHWDWHYDTRYPDLDVRSKSQTWRCLCCLNTSIFYYNVDFHSISSPFVSCNDGKVSHDLHVYWYQKHFYTPGFLPSNTGFRLKYDILESSTFNFTFRANKLKFSDYK